MVKKWNRVEKIHVFTAGLQTDSGGDERFINTDMLKEMSKNYDISLHEAPLIYGHSSDDYKSKLRRDDTEAHGWVVSLYVEGTKLFMDADVNDEMYEKMQTSFKKRSLGFYDRGSKLSPVPGEAYVRHLALLSVQPPAVKGLDAVEFSEDGNSKQHPTSKMVALIKTVLQ